MPLNQVKIRNLVNPYLNLAAIWHPTLHITQVPSGPVQSWPAPPAASPSCRDRGCLSFPQPDYSHNNQRALSLNQILKLT